MPSQSKRDPRAWEGLTPPLAEWILDAVSSMGFARMTPVQASVIPLFSSNKDVVVEAVTGSGKTLAFLIPVITRLLRLEEPLKKHHVGAIIISPTRELASQIHSVLGSLLSFHGPSAAALKLGEGQSEEFPASTLKVIPQLLLGGTTTPAQDLSHFLKNSPNLLIATPGRLLELLSSPHVHCPQSSFEVLVLDEADRLLDLGFKLDCTANFDALAMFQLQRHPKQEIFANPVIAVTKILSFLPKQRRTGLFSASVSEAVGELVRVGLRNPVKIAVKVKSSSGIDSRTPASLQMSYLLTTPSHKFPALFSLLSQLDPTPQKTIIYLSTCAAVDYFQHILLALLPKPYSLVPLHGKHPSNVRQKNFTKFVNSVSPIVLLTTDVAARGLDVPQVDLVIQIDPPSDPKAFLHRCGRAGRAGRKGLSVIFLQPGREEDYIPFLEVRKTPIAPLKRPTISTDDSTASKLTKRIRDVVLQDRALHDKAQRAFVSWLRAYSKHQASSIFRVEDLDWIDLGHAWGLLHLPKMPELKAFTGDQSLGLKATIDMSTYAYADKAREKLRLQEMEARRAEPPAAMDEEKWNIKQKRKRENEAWSLKHERKSERDEKRERRGRKREALRLMGLSEEERLKEAEASGLIEEVKRRKLNVNDGEGDIWEGFSD